MFTFIIVCLLADLMILIHKLEQCYLLVYKHHHSFNVLVNDENLDSKRRIWLLRRYMLSGVALRHIFLSRVQRYASRSHS